MPPPPSPRPARSAVPALGLIGALLLSACSVAPAGVEIHDPFEGTNRAVHEFNKDIDRAFLRPAGQVSSHLPEAIRIPVVNFSNNAGLPSAVVNNLLQGDIGGAATNTMRFILNTTVGVFGLADPAGAIGLHEVEADFGGTLAVWGLPEGAYLELPLIGPSTERDAFGRLVDFVIDPLDRVGTQVQRDWGTPAWVAEQIIDRGSFGSTVDSILYESADSYAQTRLFYLQNRRYELGEGASGGYVDPYGGAGSAAAAPAYIDPYEDMQ